MAADTINAILQDDGIFTADKFADYEANSVMPLRRCVKLCTPTTRTLTLKLIRKDMELRGPLTNCLIGNVADQDFTKLFQTMAEFADLPAPVGYGDILSA